MCGRQDRESDQQGSPTPLHSPTQVTHLLLHMGAEVQKLRLQQTDWRRGLGFAACWTLECGLGHSWGAEDRARVRHRTDSFTHVRREGRVSTISASRSVCSGDTALLPATLGALEPAGCPHMEAGLESEPVPRGCLSL